MRRSQFPTLHCSLRYKPQNGALLFACNERRHTRDASCAGREMSPVRVRGQNFYAATLAIFRPARA